MNHKLRYLKNSYILMLILVFFCSGCRKEEPVSLSSETSGGNLLDSLSEGFYNCCFRHLAESIGRFQRWAYTGNWFASDHEYYTAVEEARSLLFQPLRIGPVSIPRKGIYFFVGIEIHLSQAQLANLQRPDVLVLAIAQHPEIKKVASLVFRGRPDGEKKLQEQLTRAVDAVGVTAMAAFFVTGKAEMLVFGGADRGDSAADTGSFHWGFIVASAAGPAGLGKEFIFGEDGYESTANVFFVGKESVAGAGGGFYRAWDSEHQELGVYLQLGAKVFGQGARAGLFAAFDENDLDANIRAFIQGHTKVSQSESPVSNSQTSAGAGTMTGAGAPGLVGPAASSQTHYADERGLRICIRSGGKGGCVNQYLSPSSQSGSFMCPNPRELYHCLYGQGGETCLITKNCQQLNAGLTSSQRGLESSANSSSTGLGAAAAVTTNTVNPAQVAQDMGCTSHFAQMGSWSGCVNYLRWRASQTGRTVHEMLDAHDLSLAVQGCIDATSDRQFTTCTNRVLACVEYQWASDNYVCLAGNGGYRCLSNCQ